jgi:hypothetical protein
MVGSLDDRERPFSDLGESTLHLVPRITVDPAAQFASVTVVDAAPVVRVNVPTAFDRPAANS